MNESQKHHAEQKLTGTQEYIFYNSINFKLQNNNKKLVNSDRK